MFLLFFQGSPVCDGGCSYLHFPRVAWPLFIYSFKKDPCLFWVLLLLLAPSFPSFSAPRIIRSVTNKCMCMSCPSPPPLHKSSWLQGPRRRKREQQQQQVGLSLCTSLLQPLSYKSRILTRSITLKEACTCSLFPVTDTPIKGATNSSAVRDRSSPKSILFGHHHVCVEVSLPSPL